MEIIDNTLRNLVRFAELWEGQVFRHNNEIFMKTDEENWSGVLLSTGALLHFCNNDLCEPVKAYLTID